VVKQSSSASDPPEARDHSWSKTISRLFRSREIAKLKSIQG
jgi:hypothetical protein